MVFGPQVVQVQVMVSKYSTCACTGTCTCGLAGFYGTFVSKFHTLLMPKVFIYTCLGVLTKEGQVCTWVKKVSYHGDIV